MFISLSIGKYVLRLTNGWINELSLFGGKNPTTKTRTHTFLRVLAFKVRTQVSMVCEKCAQVYQSKDNLSINTFKLRTKCMNKHMQNKARIWLILLYRQSTYHCNIPQSEDTNFVLTLMVLNSFSSLLWNLNATANTHTHKNLRTFECIVWILHQTTSLTFEYPITNLSFPVKFYLTLKRDFTRALFLNRDCTKQQPEVSLKQIKRCISMCLLKQRSIAYLYKKILTRHTTMSSRWHRPCRRLF